MHSVAGFADYRPATNFLCHVSANLRPWLQVTEQAKRFEREHHRLSVPLVPSSLAHLAQLDALLARPGGAALLIGACGSGRRDSALLVAFCHCLAVHSPPGVHDGGLRHFKATLKDVIREAGVAGRPALLLIEDHHITDDAVLHSLNSLLASGEVPGLFTSDEWEKEVKGLEDARSESGAQSTSLADFCTARIRKVSFDLVT